MKKANENTGEDTTKRQKALEESIMPHSFVAFLSIAAIKKLRELFEKGSIKLTEEALESVISILDGMLWGAIGTMGETFIRNLIDEYKRMKESENKNEQETL
ncbi:MAG: hypothetical protein ACW98X_17805 [Promethearchaeota archaeon]|jgi:hypothetical protein